MRTLRRVGLSAELLDRCQNGHGGQCQDRHDVHKVLGSLTSAPAQTP